MSWPLLFGVVFVLGLFLLVAFVRRAELARMRRTVRRREQAAEAGAGTAQLRHPVVDLTRCLGCGTCVQVCPEDGVLELVHGQALVVNGARCVGHALCEQECPVGAITVTLADVAERQDIPALDEGLEAVGVPGLFLAGELTAQALIKTAVDHGAAVGAEVARRIEADPGDDRDGTWDLVVVGAGPAGLACALEATRAGLRFVTVDQADGPGGTVAKYPRQKLVVTRPVEIPLVGRLPRTTYAKEELIDLWDEIARAHDLPIRYGERFEGVERDAAGRFVVTTAAATYRARFVCLALGRRGTPNRLGVPGEELPKVAYDLLDAQSYTRRRVLVVGGGDAAVETALGLAEQPGNEVTLSYRKDHFFRVRARNEERLAEARARNRIAVLTGSEVRAVRPDSVDLAVRNGRGTRTVKTVTLPNDDVFVMAGGTAPFGMLERAGVRFDPELRPAAEAPGEQGTGLVRALVPAFLLSLVVLVFAILHRDYYQLGAAERAADPRHAFLRPGNGLGLWLGIAAAGLICLNLLYLVRRSPKIGLRAGSLRLWMTSHVATGILAFLCTLLHGGMAAGDTPGGKALWALAVLLVTGAIGRYFYAYVPRATNGRELELAEAKARLKRLSEEWDQGQRLFRERARAAVLALVEKRQWRGSFLGRVGALLGGQRELKATLAGLEKEGRREGVDGDQIAETIDLARRAYRTALTVAHYEDLRSVLGSWRWFHRWVAALMVLLVVFHVFHALTYGAFL